MRVLLPVSRSLIVAWRTPTRSASSTCVKPAFSRRARRVSWIGVTGIGTVWSIRVS